MVDDEAGVGMTIDERGPRLKIAEQRIFTGKSWRAAPGPGVFFQSAMTSATTGSSGSTGLTMANRSGWACCTSTA